MKIAKFLICKNTRVDERVFVLHTRTPRYLAEVKNNLDGSINIDVIDWYDTVTPDQADRIAALMRAMGDWYKGAINHV